MIVVTLDIETVTDWKPEHPQLEARWPLPHEPQPAAVTSTPMWGPRDQFPPIAKHTPCVICWLVFDSLKRSLRIKTYSRIEAEPEREAYALQDLGEDLGAAGRIVTWNGRGFDMPLLGLRAMKHRVNWSFWPQKRHRYENYKKPLAHYDIMDLLGDQGGVRAIPLDHVCELLELPGKHDLHGSDVGKVWLTDPDRVVTYCNEDVWQTWLVYLRFLECYRCSTENQYKTLRSWLALSLSWAKDQPELQRWLSASGSWCDQRLLEINEFKPE